MSWDVLFLDMAFDLSRLVLVVAFLLAVMAVVCGHKYGGWRGGVDDGEIFAACIRKGLLDNVRRWRNRFALAAVVVLVVFLCL